MNINVNNISPNEALIEIEGTIGLSEKRDTDQNPETQSVATYEKFRQQLSDIVERGVDKIRVNIRSTGGSVQDALLIHAALCELQQTQIETHCYGFVASAATIIAQAASEGCRFVASTALYLIHNASTSIDGNAIDAVAAAELLAKTDEQIAQIYASRSGLESEHFASIMARDAGRGEWLDARQTVEMGLADQVETVSPIRNAIDKIRNFLRNLVELPPVNVEQEEAPSQAHRAIEPVQAAATQTVAKEDPTIEATAISLTGNKKSYIQDIELFRD